MICSMFILNQNEYFASADECDENQCQNECMKLGPGLDENGYFYTAEGSCYRDSCGCYANNDFKKVPFDPNRHKKIKA